MSTVRIQVRRGTASQWTSVNPILAAGEMGVESDTNLFKFGNGSSTWTALAYANNSDVAIGEISQDAINTALSMGAGLTKTYNDGANTITIAVDPGVIALKSYVDSTVAASAAGIVNTADATYIPASDRGSSLGVASLDASGKVPTSQLDFEGIQDSLSTFIEGGTGVSATYNDAQNKLVISDNKVAGDGIVFEAGANGLRTIKLAPQITGSTSIFTPALTVSSTADLAALTTTGNATVGGNLTVTGNITVNGTSTTVNSTNYTVDDPMIYIGDGNQSNALDLGIVAAFNDGTYQHAGLVRDASDGKWKLFSGVTAEPGTTVDFTTYTKDTLEVGQLSATSAKIGNTTNAEIQYLNGVTSAIQTQLDSKTTPAAAATAAAAIYAPKESPALNNPLLTGTISMPAGSVITSYINDAAITSPKLADSSVTSAKIADGTIVNDDINVSAEIAKTKIAGTAITAADSATVTNAMLAGNIDSTKLSSIPQSKITNLSADLTTINTAITTNATNATNALAAKAPLDSATFTGTVVLPATTSIGPVSAVELGYIDGVTSSVQTQLTNLSTADSAHAALTTNVHGIADTSALALTATVNSGLALKAPLASPTFTGTVSGITKSMVGLGNVDNTADTAKPVSTAAQAALDLKAPLASPALTGVPTAPTAAAGTSTTQVATTAFVGTAVSALVASAPAALDTLNELATALGNDASFSTTITNALAAKAPLASPTFTGTNTVANITVSGTANMSANGIQFSDGTQTKVGVPSVTTFGSSFAASGTVAVGEQDKFVPVAGAVVITLPATGYSTGQSIDFYQASGTGASFASTNSVVGTPGLKFRTTNSVVTAMKTAAGWLIFGDLSA